MGIMSSLQMSPDIALLISRDGVEWTPVPGVSTANIKFDAPDPATPDRLLHRPPTSFTLTLRGLNKTHSLIKALGIRWPNGSRRAGRRAHRKALKKRGRA